MDEALTASGPIVASGYGNFFQQCTPYNVAVVNNVIKFNAARCNFPPSTFIPGATPFVTVSGVTISGSRLGFDRIRSVRGEGNWIYVNGERVLRVFGATVSGGGASTLPDGFTEMFGGDSTQPASIRLLDNGKVTQRIVFTRQTGTFPPALTAESTNVDGNIRISIESDFWRSDSDRITIVSSSGQKVRTFVVKEKTVPSSTQGWTATNCNYYRPYPDYAVVSTCNMQTVLFPRGEYTAILTRSTGEVRASTRFSLPALKGTISGLTNLGFNPAPTWSAPLSDLSITALSAARTGGVVNVNYAVKNSGAIAAGAHLISFGLSDGRNSVPMSCIDSVPGLTVGASYPSTATRRVTCALPPGAVGAFVEAVVDADAVVRERLETNNVRAVRMGGGAVGPMYAISKPADGFVQSVAGSVTARVTVTNVGSAPANALTYAGRPIAIGMYLSRDLMLDDPLLCDYTPVPNLAAGGSVTLNVRCATTASTPKGLQYVMLRADNSNVVIDADERAGAQWVSPLVNIQ